MGAIYHAGVKYGGQRYDDIVVGVEKKVGTITIGNTTYDRYVKIVDCGMMPSGTTSSVASTTTPHYTSYVGVINVAGVGCNASGTTIPLPYVFGDNEHMVRLFVDSTNVTIQDWYNWSSYHAYITLEYYK